MLSRTVITRHVAPAFPVLAQITGSLHHPSAQPGYAVDRLFRLFSTGPAALCRRRPLIFEGRNTQDSEEKEQQSRRHQGHGESSEPQPQPQPQPQPHEPQQSLPPGSPFYLETAYSIFAKRAPRPFPPPFLCTPSHSFSDPLTTHQDSRDHRPKVEGRLLRGITNGDDAIITALGGNFLVVNDGVGAWAQKERGHAALWSRLIAHFWAEEVEQLFSAATAATPPAGGIPVADLDVVGCLQRAYEHTKSVTASANDILGTTTAASALLYHEDDKPVVLATNLGDCAVMILRPGHDEMVYKTQEQWHWFDCPRQLGTNSPDTPDGNAVMDKVPIEEGDVVLVVSDGLTDNLWEPEIVNLTNELVQKWHSGHPEAKDGVVYLARSLMDAAREVALDPMGESPYMERALDEGLAISEGGKLDDISVVVGVCRRKK